MNETTWVIYQTDCNSKKLGKWKTKFGVPVKNQEITLKSCYSYFVESVEIFDADMDTSLMEEEDVDGVVYVTLSMPSPDSLKWEVESRNALSGESISVGVTTTLLKPSVGEYIFINDGWHQVNEIKLSPLVVDTLKQTHGTLVI
ncbi:hypothetical protein [Moorena sp. SIO3A2]|uniref:hypothetical protein n=1 Tax=Moorena sp. SIO3A2 TaxID=2607841 RepID=UPI0013BCEA43|nr:hypothetical protein [Moorena sp. SIO3A2]NER90333.1 hypothetical protein [Moorena sp. SIO3A2]